jgi:hypothetical protein
MPGCDQKEGCEFHHVVPELKRFTVSNSWRYYGMDKVVAEIAKCVVLCGTHHNMVHSGDIELPEEITRDYI